MPDEMISIQPINGKDPAHHILRLSGPLTLRSLFPFQDAARADKAPVLIVDLAGVNFIDSVGLGSLVGAFVTRQKDGRKLALVGANDRVVGAMHIAGLEKVFTMFPTVEEAERNLL